METPQSSDIVSLAPGPKGGLDVPVDAFNLAFELLNRDLTLIVEGEKLLIRGPHGAKPDLSASEVERIKKWKLHLVALLAYQPPPLFAVESP